jgi:hypothetical protein
MLISTSVLARRHDPRLEPGMIVAQTPRDGEGVDCGTVIGVIVSDQDLGKKQVSP